MATLEFFIPGEFTTLNEWIAASNSNRHAAAQIKKVETRRAQLQARGVPPVQEYPVDLELTWYRENRKSDPDNIAFAIKFILDGLQAAGVLRQDTWASVRTICHRFEIDKQNPGVQIVIKGRG